MRLIEQQAASSVILNLTETLLSMSEKIDQPMYHFDSKAAYDSFIEKLATNEASVIQKWGAYEVANDIIALVDDRSTEIEVGGGSVPNVDGVNAPLCPITVLEYSEQTSGIPRDEVENITHIAVELLEQELQNQV